MKVTKRRLTQLIQEEITNLFKEEGSDVQRDRNLGGLSGNALLEAGWEDGSNNRPKNPKYAENSVYMDGYKIGKKEYDSYGAPDAPLEEGGKEELAARIRAHRVSRGEKAGSRATGTPKPEDSVRAALGAVDKEYRRFAPDDLESIKAFEDGLRSMIDQWRVERGETPSSMMSGDERLAAINRHFDRMEKTGKI